MFDSWPQKLSIEFQYDFFSKYIQAIEKKLPFVIFEPQENDKENYLKLVKFLSENKSVSLYVYI